MTAHIICFLHNECFCWKSPSLLGRIHMLFWRMHYNTISTDQPSDPLLTHILSCGDKLAGKPHNSIAYKLSEYIDRRKTIDSNIETLKRMYDHFNARDIDGVLASLADDVVWANGMDGGYVYGHEAVREYWTRQWAIVSPHVEPVQFNQATDGSIIVEVQQSIRDLEGKRLQAQTHGLQDKVVGHVFRFQEGKVVRFDIQDTSF